MNSSLALSTMLITLNSVISGMSFLICSSFIASYEIVSPLIFAFITLTTLFSSITTDPLVGTPEVKSTLSTLPAHTELAYVPIHKLPSSSILYVPSSIFSLRSLALNMLLLIADI